MQDVSRCKILLLRCFNDCIVVKQATNSSARPTNRPLKRSGGERKASWDDQVQCMEDGIRLKSSGGQRSHDSGGQRSHESGGGHRRGSDEDILGKLKNKVDYLIK